MGIMREFGRAFFGGAPKSGKNQGFSRPGFPQPPQPGQAQKKKSVFDLVLGTGPRPGNGSASGSFFEKSISGGKRNINEKNFSQKIRDDRGGNFFSETNLNRGQREDLTKKMLEGLRGKGRGSLSYGNVHLKDIKEAGNELGKGKLGAYKDLSHKDRQNLKKEIDTLLDDKQ